MKSLLVLLLWLALALPTLAQDGSPTPTPTPAESPGLVVPENSAQADLRLLKEHMEDAFNARDIKSVMEGVADRVVFTTVEGEVVVGKEKVQSYLERMLAGPNPRVKEAATRVTVDDVMFFSASALEQPAFSIAYGYSDDRYLLAHNTSAKLQPRWTAALARDNVGWKVVSFQYTLDMYENPVVRYSKKQTAIVGIGALGLGLLLGFLIGRRKAGSRE